MIVRLIGTADGLVLDAAGSVHRVARPWSATHIEALFAGLEALHEQRRQLDQATMDYDRRALHQALADAQDVLGDGLADLLLGRSAGREGAGDSTVYDVLAALLRQQETLRLVLEIEPEAPAALAGLPWELLRWPDPPHRPLGVDDRFTLIRRGEGAAALLVSRPLRVLALSGPQDEAGAAHLAAVQDGWTSRLVSGDVSVEVLPAAEVARRRGHADVIHLLAHGGRLPAERGAGARRFRVWFPDAQGRSVPLRADRLIDRLEAHRAPALAVLVVCGSGAGEAELDAPVDRPLVADLLAAGCPAVIAMHGEILIEASDVMSRALYGALAEGVSLDAALQRARRMMWRWSRAEGRMRTPDHWFRPTLYVSDLQALSLLGPPAPPDTRVPWRLVIEPGPAGYAVGVQLPGALLGQVEVTRLGLEALVERHRILPRAAKETGRALGATLLPPPLGARLQRALSLCQEPVRLEVDLPLELALLPIEALVIEAEPGPLPPDSADPSDLDRLVVALGRKAEGLGVRTHLSRRGPTAGAAEVGTGPLRVLVVATPEALPDVLEGLHRGAAAELPRMVVYEALPLAPGGDWVRAVHLRLGRRDPAVHGLQLPTEVADPRLVEGLPASLLVVLVGPEGPKAAIRLQNLPAVSTPDSACAGRLWARLAGGGAPADVVHELRATLATEPDGGFADLVLTGTLAPGPLVAGTPIAALHDVIEVEGLGVHPGEAQIERPVELARALEALALPGSALWIHGPPGSGRTLLAAHIAHRLRLQGLPPVVRRGALSRADLWDVILEAQECSPGAELLPAEPPDRPRLWARAWRACAVTFIWDDVPLDLDPERDAFLPPAEISHLTDLLRADAPSRLVLVSDAPCWPAGWTHHDMTALGLLPLDFRATMRLCAALPALSQVPGLQVWQRLGGLPGALVALDDQLAGRRPERTWPPLRPGLLPLGQQLEATLPPRPEPAGLARLDEMERRALARAALFHGPVEVEALGLPDVLRGRAVALGLIMQHEQRAVVPRSVAVHLPPVEPSELDAFVNSICPVIPASLSAWLFSWPDIAKDNLRWLDALIALGHRGRVAEGARLVCAGRLALPLPAWRAMLVSVFEGAPAEVKAELALAWAHWQVLNGQSPIDTLAQVADGDHPQARLGRFLVMGAWLADGGAGEVAATAAALEAALEGAEGEPAPELEALGRICLARLLTEANARLQAVAEARAAIERIVFLPADGIRQLRIDCHDIAGNALRDQGDREGGRREWSQAEGLQAHLPVLRLQRGALAALGQGNPLGDEALQAAHRWWWIETTLHGRTLRRITLACLVAYVHTLRAEWWEALDFAAAELLAGELPGPSRDSLWKPFAFALHALNRPQLAQLAEIRAAGDERLESDLSLVFFCTRDPEAAARLGVRLLASTLAPEERARIEAHLKETSAAAPIP